MKNKIFLSSMLIMSVAPAMAETFPTDGYMKENKTYTNAATETNMDGVYEGTVNANAEYETINYLLNAGQYLPADSETVTPCPAGSFCSGIGNVNYNENLAQGIETCPSGYASSADGSSSDTQCYRTCDINNMGTSFTNIAHATAVSGNDYYGNGTDTCEPTACVNGWHLKAGVNGSAIASTIGTGAGENSAYVKGSGSFIEVNHDGQGAKGASYYGLSTSNPNTWAVDYGTNGMLVGQGRCSTVQGISDFNYSTNELNQPITTHTTSELGAEGGGYCYCNVTGYTPDGGTLQAVSSPWVFGYIYSSAAVCAVRCAGDCAKYMRDASSDSLAFRAALLGAIESSPAMCEANTITINWSNADANDISANNAGTATYGSDVRTPVKAQTIKGKTFRGWRFSAPEQTTTGN